MDEKIIHSPADLAPRGKSFAISAAYLCGSGENAPAKLTLALSAGDEYKKLCDMLPTGDAEKDYVIYSAVVDAAVTLGCECLKYEFRDGGYTSAEYTVPVRGLPANPPLAISEILVKPKAGRYNSYVEVVNLSDGPVDLYDYKLMYHKGEKPEEGVRYEDFITSEKGAEVLAPGETALLWICAPICYNKGKGKYRTVDGFIAKTNRDNPGVNVTAENTRIIKIDVAMPDGYGSYTMQPNAFKLLKETELCRYYIVPRELCYDGATVSLTFNDTPVNDGALGHSSIWQLDKNAPGLERRVLSSTLPTPGKLDDAQVFPDASDVTPPLVFAALPESVDNSADGLKVTMFVAEDKKLFEPTVYIAGGDGEFAAHRMTVAGKDGDIYRCEYLIKAKTLLQNSRLRVYFEASDSVFTSTLRSAAAPFEIKINDTTGPVVLFSEPENTAFLEDNASPVISARFFDISGIDANKCSLVFDGEDVSADCELDIRVFADENTGSGEVPVSSICYYALPLEDGEHTFTLTLADKTGRTSVLTSVFSTGTPEKMNLYHGEVHCHTADSDGSQTPADAFRYARDTGKVNFFAVTEHTHYVTEKLYERQKENADEFNAPGSFAALYGWELTWNNASGYYGHINVLGAGWIHIGHKNITMRELFDQVKSDPHAVGMFNHPGEGWGSFDEFRYYDKETDAAMCLAEIKSPAYDYYYMLALARGWHVSPMYNEDNHAPNWTTATPSTSYILAPALTRFNVIDAFKRRRTYSTSDPTLALFYSVNKKWLGSRLTDPESLDFDIRLSTLSETGLGKVELVAEDNIVLASSDVGTDKSFAWKFTLEPLYDYYYVRVTGEGQYTVSAPVFVERRNKPIIADMRASLVDGSPAENENLVTVTVFNPGKRPLEKLKADFYLCPESGFDITKEQPYSSVSLPDTAREKCAVARARFPHEMSKRRVSVVVSGECGGVGFSVTRFIYLFRAVVTEILPCTKDYNGVKNPFPYVKFYNNSNYPLTLDGDFLKYWNTTGKAPAEDGTFPINGVVAAPKSSFVLWCKPTEGNDLTVADFNAFYGVSLEEGKNIAVVSCALLECTREGRIFDIEKGDKTVLCRARYNFGTDAGADVNEDNIGLAVAYAYKNDMTVSVEKTAAAKLPSPDGTDAASVPPVISQADLDSLESAPKSKASAFASKAAHLASSARRTAQELGGRTSGSVTKLADRAAMAVNGAAVKCADAITDKISEISGGVVENSGALRDKATAYVDKTAREAADKTALGALKAADFLSLKCGKAITRTALALKRGVRAVNTSAAKAVASCSFKAAEKTAKAAGAGIAAVSKAAVIAADNTADAARRQNEKIRDVLGENDTDKRLLIAAAATGAVLVTAFIVKRNRKRRG